MPLHPSAKALIQAVAEQGAPAWSDLSPNESRELFASLKDRFGDAPDVYQVQDLSTTKTGVPLRLYRPSPEATAAILYFHGGGWVIGDLETHDALCRRLALDSGRVVIAVDYRLAPESPFPAALDDTCEAFLDCVNRAKELGIDHRRIAVGGDSAGGNLAAALCLKARDQNFSTPIESQVLIYPVVTPQFDSESYQAFAEGFVLTRDTMQWFWEQYTSQCIASTGMLPHDQGVLPYADLAAHAFEDLPPACIVLAEYDVLRTEGEMLAHQLQCAGVEVTKRCYEGMLHGFVHYSSLLPPGIEASIFIGSWLQSRLDA